MSEKPLKVILQTIANEGVPLEEVNLWPGVRNGLEETRISSPRRLSPATRWRIALPALIVLALLIATLAIVGPDGALAALRGLLRGYIPGIGLVDEGAGLRVLAAEVSLERDGITVSVDQVVIDSERTVVIYQADGLPPTAFPRSEDAPFCSSNAQLRLPDGTVLQIIEGLGNGWASGYKSRLVYAAVPLEVSEATLMIPCLEGTSPGAAPQDWELALRFIAAPPDMTVVPVLEVTSSPEAAETSNETSAIGLYLERVIELDDSYILVGTFRQGEGFPGAMVMGISSWPEITDANGQALPYEFPSDLDLGSQEMGIFPWAYQIPKGFAAPLVLTLEAVDVESPADVTFHFDAGSDPQVGQEWTLNQELQVADHVVLLVSVERLENGYEFRFQSDSSVSGVSVLDSEYQPVGGFGGGGQGDFTAGFEYSHPVPTGMLTFQITALIAQQPGPWTLSWQPPQGDEPVPTLVVPHACLALDRWQQASENPTLPQGLTGKLIAYGRILEDGQPLSPENAGVFAVDLEGGGHQVLGPGTWPSLSPDGSRAAYSWTDGLHVVDLASGENRLLPGTSTNDYNPRWSPDGLQIAFVRTDDLNLYVVNVDGSGLRRVTEGPEYEQLIGWLPGSQTLNYAVPGPEGMQLRFLDLLTGVISYGFMIEKGKGIDAAVSPDRATIAFIDLAPGKMGYGLYLAGLDGSDRRLIAQLDYWGIGSPAWSPDGNWLIVSISNNDLPNSAPIPALIEPKTCEVIALAGIDGYVHGWAP